MIKIHNMNRIYITSKIKNGMIYSFAFGFGAGLIPNKINIRFNDRICYNASLPLITGCVGLIGFVFSPLLISNYLFNGVYFDKLFDKYDINVARNYQYDGQDDKYAFPSLLTVNITTLTPPKININQKV